MNMKYSGSSQISNNLDLYFYLIVALFNVQQNADNALEASRLPYTVTRPSQSVPFEMQHSQAISSVLSHRQFPITLIFIIILLSYYIMSSKISIMCWLNHSDITT